MPTLMGRDSDDPQVARRGRPLRRRDRLRRRHGRAVRRHPARRRHDVDDDQRPGRAGLLHVCSSPPSGRAPTLGKLNGTLQTDIFKEYIAQKEWLFAPEPHLRLIGDLMEYCAEKIPAYKPLSVSGYHIREAGSTAAQELAFTLADGFGYVELGLSPRPRRRRRSRPACRSSSTPTSTSSRRSRSSAPPAASGRAGCATSTARQTEKAQWLRFHTQTAGVSLTAQQPYNNVVRTGSRGAGRGARRHQLAAHQRPRRDARAAERAGRRDRAAHPAGDHGGDRRRQRRRPARRLAGTSRRSPTRSRPRPNAIFDRILAMGGSDLTPRRHRGLAEAATARRVPDDHGPPARHRGRLVHVRDRRGRLPVPDGAGEGRQEDRRRQRATPTRSPTTSRSCGSPTRSRSSRCATLAARAYGARRGRGRRRDRSGWSRSARTDGNMIPAMLDAVPGRGDARRDLRRAARRVGRVPRAGPLLRGSRHRVALPSAGEDGRGETGRRARGAGGRGRRCGRSRPDESGTGEPAGVRRHLGRSRTRRARRVGSAEHDVPAAGPRAAGRADPVGAAGLQRAGLGLAEAEPDPGDRPALLRSPHRLRGIAVLRSTCASGASRSTPAAGSGDDSVSSDAGAPSGASGCRLWEFVDARTGHHLGEVSEEVLPN